MCNALTIIPLSADFGIVFSEIIWEGGRIYKDNSHHNNDHAIRKPEGLDREQIHSAGEQTT